MYPRLDSHIVKEQRSTWFLVLEAGRSQTVCWPPPKASMSWQKTKRPETSRTREAEEAALPLEPTAPWCSQRQNPLSLDTTSPWCHLCHYIPGMMKHQHKFSRNIQNTASSHATCAPPGLHHLLGYCDNHV